MRTLKFENPDVLEHWEELLTLIIKLVKLMGDIRPQSEVRNPKENLTLYKILLLQPISRLYEIPEFEIGKNPGILIETFYMVAVKLTKELSLDENGFRYYKMNFTNEKIDNKPELIEFLLREMEYPSFNNSRYLLGFRSIWFILRNNLETIDGKYIADINYRLSPFFEAYKNKSMLVPGVSSRYL
jgi:hypothetical protein